MTVVTIWMINSDSDMECGSGVESYSELNVGEELNGKEVNVSNVVPVSV